jgi:hypothetical protein
MLRSADADTVEKITCPSFVTGNETDTVSTGQGKVLFDQLTCPKTFRLFTRFEGAEGHCEGMAPIAFWTAAFDRLGTSWPEVRRQGETKALPERSTATQEDTAAHEMLVSAWPSSMSVPALHVAPFQAKTRPMESTARQKVVVGHETEVRPEALLPVRGGSEAIDTGAEKPEPFQVRTAPLLSTMTQNEVVAQETELSCPWVSTSPGVAVEHRGAAFGGHAEGRGHARDLVGCAPRPDIAGPATAAVGERVPLPIDGDAERGPRAVDRRDALCRRDGRGRLPIRPSEERDLVHVGRSGAEIGDAARDVRHALG